MKEIKIYATVMGKRPFAKWLSKIKDNGIRVRIKNRIDYLRFGYYEDCKVINEGVKELRLQFGPGYRIYFGEQKNSIILLIGGHKGSQEKDITRAFKYWHDFRRNNDE